MPKVFDLSKLERVALNGIQAREREIKEKILEPLQADFAEILSQIASRLEIDANEFGTRYQLDLQSFTVRELPDPAVQPAEPEPAKTKARKPK